MDSVTTHANGYGQWHAQGEGVTEPQAFQAIWAELEHRGDADEDYALVLERCRVHPSCWAEVDQ